MKTLGRLRRQYVISTVIVLGCIGLAGSPMSAEESRAGNERIEIRTLMQRVINLWNKDDAKALIMVFVQTESWSNRKEL